MNIIVVLDVTVYRLVQVYLSEESDAFIFRVEFLNDGKLLPDYTTSYPWNQ
jgi:hypothetical protein